MGPSEEPPAESPPAEQSCPRILCRVVFNWVPSCTSNESPRFFSRIESSSVYFREEGKHDPQPFEINLTTSRHQEKEQKSTYITTRDCIWCFFLGCVWLVGQCLGANILDIYIYTIDSLLYSTATRVQPFLIASRHIAVFDYKSGKRARTRHSAAESTYFCLMIQPPIRAYGDTKRRAAQGESIC